MSARNPQKAATLAALAAIFVWPAQPVLAQTEILGGPAETIHIDQLGPGDVVQRTISRGKSLPVKFNAAVRNTIVTDDKIADVLSLTSGQFMIIAKAPGQTDIRFIDGNGRPVLTMDVRVEMDVSAFAPTIARVAPNARVQAEAIGTNVILTGTVANAAEADTVVRVARTFVDRPDAVVNTMNITGKDQVMLKAEVIEVQTSKLKQFGIDLNGLLSFIQKSTINLSNTNNYTVSGGYQGGSSATFSFPGAGTGNITAALRSFERDGLMTIIAEPYAVAVSGESAKFHSGGSYPVPQSRDSQGNVQLEFKDYGVGLGFTPTVLSGGRISVKVSTEVSDLTSQGAFTLNSGSGSTLTVPGLISRSYESVVEMPSGGSQMASGLVLDTSAQSLDKMPGVSDIPLVGVLGRSRDYKTNQTELVIIITATIVDPTARQNLQTPADGLVLANDAETLLLGRLNKYYQTPEAAVAGRRYQGPFGHVIE